MRQSDTEQYRATLVGKMAELSVGLRSRDGITIEKAADTLDQVQFASERELAIRNLDRESKLLQSVRHALARIDDGSWGVCQRCDSAINPKRLNAIPWAVYCVTCQEIADRQAREGETEESADELALA